MKQTTFASLAFDRKKKQTRREKFLAEMEQAVPWPELLAVIEPHYPKAGRRGRQPYPLATMLRLYFLQQWYALSDPGLEDALYEIESNRCGVLRVWSWPMTRCRMKPRSSTSGACWNVTS